MLSLSFPTAPEIPPHIAHGLPSPVGSRPSYVFGRSSGHKGPGEPPHLHPGSSSQRRPRPGCQYSTRNVSTKMRECPHGVPLLGHSAQGLHMAWENRQAAGRWTGMCWAAAGMLTPSIGGGGLCCRLGPQSHYWYHLRC